MGNTLSKRTRKDKKVNFDSYDMKQIAQSYGSDLRPIREIGVNLNNYIDCYPNFKIWAKTKDISESVEESGHRKEDELLQ
ncbi:hypothetical protein CLTEP_25430 [Clostridium tepidiprofundi DSM 19306]|uniref:Uncharacterized protein n=1 Tax=Clostridium tepidiprofundi DSM 19306 TaxID=1121338 RepID=A0A151ASJ8_9CLOT|nr:hypothetical protein [Clostridium tepidiprofundi]KYH30628.1 hypothetical protein CLTEP_25430 [Clostridium tepidiprofundi DSM 19306]